MFNFTRSKSRTLIGLDINSDEIRLVQLSRAKHKVRIEKVALEALPPGAIMDGKIHQPATVKSVVAKMVQDTQTQGLATALALPAHCVISKRIKLQAFLREEECEAEISAHLDRYLPEVTEELCFDFWFVNSLPVARRDILLIASRLELLNTYASVVTDAGLVVKIVDVDSYALIRAAQFCLASDDMESVALLHINETAVEFIVFHQNEIIFSQHWHGRQEELLQQLQRIIQQCFSMHRHVQISRLVVAGIFSGLPEYLAKQLAVTIVHINPFTNTLFAPQVDQNALHKIGSRLLIAFGLGLRKMPRW